MNITDLKTDKCDCSIELYLEKLHTDKNELSEKTKSIEESVRELKTFIVGGIDRDGRQVKSLAQGLKEEIVFEIKNRNFWRFLRSSAILVGIGLLLLDRLTSKI